MKIHTALQFMVLPCRIKSKLAPVLSSKSGTPNITWYSLALQYSIAFKDVDGRETVQILIRLLLNEQSDLELHCLLNLSVPML